MELIRFLSDVNSTTITVFLLIFIITAVVYKALFDSQTKRNLPPGPRGLPVFGCLLYLIGKDPRKKLAEYVEEYGEVFKLQMGTQTIVVLNSAEAIKDAFVKLGNTFSDRPHIMFMDYITERKGIISSDGKLWREQRQFTHTVLRDFGMGKATLEDKIHDVVNSMIAYLDKMKCDEFDNREILTMTVSNVICNIVMNTVYDYDDQFYKYRIAGLEHSFKVLGNAGIINFFPILLYLPGDVFKIKEIFKCKEIVHEWYECICMEHAKTVENDGLRDLIDAYLLKMASEDENNNQSTFTMDQLVQVVGDLLAAGAETTATTLRWGFVYLLHHPDVQKAIQKEIHDVIGPSRNPCMSDRPNMPYTEAYITELQRIADIVPFGVPHAVTCDVNFRGYVIPKGTQIWPNLYYVHHNEASWINPEEFKPERFLDKDGKYQKPDNVIPFSVGRRICVGESLARMELFLVTTSLLQKFNVLPPRNGELPPLKGILGVTHMPQPYKMRLQNR